MLRAALLAAAAAAAAAAASSSAAVLPAPSSAASDWAVCPGARSGSYSAWNSTSCPPDATCCTSVFSVSGVGCCPFQDGVCCPTGYTCCPSGSQCVPGPGSSWQQTWTCAPAGGGGGGGSPTPAKSVCKPGPALPMDPKRKNVLVIGDSISIGYTPFLASNVSDIALVQHSPWDLSDGGAEEVDYGLQCLPYFLASPSGQELGIDLLLFNWGMHDGPMGNETIPGQNAPPTDYTPTLSAIVEAVTAWAKPRGTQLLFVLTTPYLCNSTSNGCVQNLNNQARAVMGAAGVPVVDNYDAIIGACGPPPRTSCFGVANCFCPHCPTAGYEFLARTVLGPAVRSVLTGGSGSGSGAGASFLELQ